MQRLYLLLIPYYYPLIKKVSSIITRRATTRGRHPCRFSNYETLGVSRSYPHQWRGSSLMYLRLLILRSDPRILPRSSCSYAGIKIDPGNRHGATPSQVKIVYSSGIILVLRRVIQEHSSSIDSLARGPILLLAARSGSW